MDIATYEDDRWIVRDTGQMIILRSKLVPSVAIAFPHWDAVLDAIGLLVRGLSPEMRHELANRLTGSEVGSYRNRKDF
jgi:hypothetical protein